MSTHDTILVELAGPRHRITDHEIYERHDNSIFVFGKWFDYIGTQDGDRIYQERKTND